MASLCLDPTWDSKFRQGTTLIWIKKLRSNEVRLGSLLSKLNFSPFDTIFYGLCPRSLVYPTVGKSMLIRLRVPAKPAVETNWWIRPRCPAYPPMKNRWVFLRGPAKPDVESSWWNLLWGPANPAATTSLWMKPVVGEIRWVLLRCPVKPAVESTWGIFLRGPAKPAVETNCRITFRRPAKPVVEINAWIFMRPMVYQSAAYLGMELTRVSGPFVRHPVDGVVEDGRWSLSQRPMGVLGSVVFCFKGASRCSLVKLLECLALQWCSSLCISHNIKLWGQSYSVLMFLACYCLYYCVFLHFSFIFMLY